MRKIFSTIIASVFVLGSTTVATALPIGSPHQISDFDVPFNMTSCGGPGIGYNQVTGTTLVAWTTSTDSTESVEFSLLNEDGTAEAVNSYSGNDSGIPPLYDCEPVAVEGTPDGGFFIAWSDDTQLNGLVVDSDGEAVGSHFDVSSHESYDDIETLDIVWAPEYEQFLVAWKADLVPFGNGDQQIVGRFFDAEVNSIGDDFAVTNSPDQFDNSMDLTFGDGVWAVVGGDDSGNIARVTFIEPNGDLSDVFDCSAEGTSTGSASIAYNAESNVFLCVWKEGSTATGNFLSSDGSLSEVTDIQLVDSTVNGKPRVESLGPDGWILAWHLNGSVDVNGAHVDLDGVLVGDIETVSNGVANNSVERNFRPAVVFSPATGHAYIAWTRNDTVSQETEIYSRAWYVTEGLGVPEALADTGLNAGSIALVAGGLVAAGAVVARRRRA